MADTIIDDSVILSELLADLRLRGEHKAATIINRLLAHLERVETADVNAMENARSTFEAIRKTDPGVYDDIIDESLSLIRFALNIQFDLLEELANG